ncbi:MAG: hypothetical protein GTN80_10710 [Nitrososphaeria archaeon]|nr:hypothetical protein [Nitrososphaeria archaeon]NIN53570.1 hypothetical protein [Nitrososphaeria archaeon]NIQ34090.1 hypothetical protein [Nitrososphaeria archaeon]
MREALEELGLREETGLLKLTTLYPLPKELIKGYLEKALMVLIVEEGESYLEENIRALCADMEPRLIPKFYGKLTDHIPFQGELTPDIVLNAICKVKNIEYESPISIKYEELCKESAEITSKRTITFCPGCPHRASYWCILQAIKQNGGRGIVTGDVGCYTLGVSYHDIVSTKQCMGASIGVAHGLGKLSRFGLEEPAIAVIGDSTFYHAGIPGLINCVYNSSDVTVIILDNNATAMTGFQPHPGTGMGSTGKTAPRVPIEDVCRGVGARDVRVLDPFEVRESIRNIYECMTTQGVHVIIFRRECALLVNRRKAEEDILYSIDQEKCGGTKCKICSEQFNCPACTWEVDKAKIDEVQCNGCGVCATLCPYKAIYEVRAE